MAEFNEKLRREKGVRRTIRPSDPNVAAKHAKAARRLWALVLNVGDFSTIAVEYNMLATEEEKIAYANAFIDKWERVEAQSLNNMCSTWQKLVGWGKRRIPPLRIAEGVSVACSPRS